MPSESLRSLVIWDQTYMHFSRKVRSLTMLAVGIAWSNVRWPAGPKDRDRWFGHLIYVYNIFAWMCFQWKNKDRSWSEVDFFFFFVNRSGVDIHCDKTDRDTCFIRWDEDRKIEGVEELQTCVRADNMTYRWQRQHRQQLIFVMRLILRTSHDLQIPLKNMTYRWQRAIQHIQRPEWAQNAEEIKTTAIRTNTQASFDRGRSTGNPIGNRPLVHFETECVLSGGKKGTIIHCLFACILPSSTIMLQIGQQAPPHPKHYHLQ